jgi:ubiquitin-protein ligase
MLGRDEPRQIRWPVDSLSLDELKTQIAYLESVPAPVPEDLDPEQLAPLLACSIEPHACSCARARELLSSPPSKLLERSSLTGGQGLCALCRNTLADPCIMCQAENENENESSACDCSCGLATGMCGHVFHAHCISRHLRTVRADCPLDMKPWNWPGQASTTTTLVGPGLELKFGIEDKDPQELVRELLQDLVQGPCQVKEVSGSVLAVCGVNAHPDRQSLKIQVAEKQLDLGKPDFSAPVQTVARSAAKLLGCSVTGLDLYFRGKKLHAEASLAQHGVTPGSVLEARLALPGVELDLYGPTARLTTDAQLVELLASGETLLAVARCRPVWDENLNQAPLEDLAKKRSGSDFDAGVLQLFSGSPAWLPGLCPETDPGAVGTLLSTLYVLSGGVQRDASLGSVVCAWARKALGTGPAGPAVIALKLVLERRTALVTDHDRALVSSAVWSLLRRLVPAGLVSETRLLDHSAVLFRLALEEPDVDVSAEVYEVVETPGAQETYVWKGARQGRQDGPQDEQKSALTPTQWRLAVTEPPAGLARIVRLVPALRLPRAETPCLTRNEAGQVVVCAGRGKGAELDLVMMNPLTGTETTMSADKLARALEGKFGNQLGLSGEELDSRVPTEAIVVCLDTSMSMQGPAFPTVRRLDDEDTWPTPVEPSLDRDERLALKARVVAHKLVRRLVSLYGPRAVIRQLAEHDAEVSRNRDWLARELARELAAEHLSGGNGNASDVDSESDGEPPDEFVCPITQRLMRDPVTLEDGHTYEREAIRDWLRTHRTSPKTREPVCTITPNRALKGLIERWTARERPLGRSTQVPVTIALTRKNGRIDQKWACKVDATETVQTLLLQLWAHAQTQGPSRIHLMTDVVRTGDTYYRGTPMDPNRTVKTYLKPGAQTLECEVFNRSYRETQQPRTDLSRLDMVKQQFAAFVNRSSAYDYAHHIGLVTFGSDCKVACSLTPVFETFRCLLDEVATAGDTRLYDALAQSCDLLTAWKRARPEHNAARLRVLCLSDGRDTCSEHEPYQVLKRMHDAGVTLDLIQIGQDRDAFLAAMTGATGGVYYAPKSPQEALRLNELETILSVKERARGALPRIPAKAIYDLGLYMAPAPQTDKPEILRPLLKLPCTSLERAVLDSGALEHKVEAEPDTVADTVSQDTAAPRPFRVRAKATSDRRRRVLNELVALQRTPHPQVDVFPGRQDTCVWKVTMEGPEGTSYAGGCWLATVEFPEAYPSCAPVFKFATPMMHVNVSAYGKVCHSVFDRNWSPDTSMLRVFALVYGLLLAPEPQDPLDSALAAQYYEDPAGFELEVQAHTQKHAGRMSRADWEVKLTQERCVE